MHITYYSLRVNSLARHWDSMQTETQAPKPKARRPRKRKRRRASPPSPAPLSPPSPSPAELCRLASRYFPHVQTVASYISLINASLPPSVPKIILLQPTDPPAYKALINRLFISPPSPVLPPHVAEGLLPHAPPALESILSSAISTALSTQTPFLATNQNVLAAGFTPSRPGGQPSLLQNLDLRAPSGAVTTLISAPFRRLFGRIGYVAARHVLSSAALLLFTPDGSGVMQLCGALRPPPPPTPPTRHIILKRHILYHGPLQAGATARTAQPLNTGLPPGHVLQSLRPGHDGAPAALGRAIFPALFAASRRRRAPEVPPQKRRRLARGAAEGDRELLRFPRRLKGLAPLLGDVVARCGKRSFRALLSETCPLETCPLGTRSKVRRLSCRELSGARTKAGNVAAFLVRAVRQAVPLAVFGSHVNRGLFEDAVHALIRHRSQREVFDVGQLLARRGMRVTDVAWLYRAGADGKKVCNPTDLKFRQARLAEMVSWLFRGFCLPLLRQNFYVTEAEVSRNRVLYYRREVWSALTDTTLDSMLRSDHHQFSMLSPKSLASARRQRETVVKEMESCFGSAAVFSFSSIRFLPKPSGARGIQRRRAISFRSFMNARLVPKAGAYHAPNASLLSISQAATKYFYANVLEILWSEMRSNASPLGASVFSSTDIYAKYADLASRWRAAGRPRMFFASMDIARSFDTVPLASLLRDVLPPILRKDEYVILRYVVVKRPAVHSPLVYRYRYYACEEMGEESHFSRLLRTKLAARHRGALFIDLCDVTRLKRADVLRALGELFGNNVVHIPRRNRRGSETAYASQCQGLPQGSPLSGILTSLFYGYVEAKDLVQYLPRYGDAGGEVDAPLQLFMRQVDDTIFASAVEGDARRFAERMRKGWDEEHGFVTNPSKTRSNFDPHVGGKTGLRFIPWCGYIIDTLIMEVRNDYDRYVTSGFRIRDTLCIVFGSGAMRSFSAKALTCFKPKLHAILVDASINCRQTIALNLYQAALLAALKLCSYALALFAGGEARAERGTGDFFRRTAFATVGSFCDMVAVAVSSVVASGAGSGFPVKEWDLRYIALRGFYDVILRRMDVWYAKEAKAAFELAVGNARFAMVGGTVKDLADVFSSAMSVSSNKAMWAIRL